MSQYLKPDCELGYIEDQAEIESLKINNLRHAILGCMLGDFDETGAYVVEPEIVQELIEMPKYIVETMDNIEICKSALKLDKQISFAVTLEGNKATLSLLEKLSYEANFAINSGTYSNINEYILDTVETSGEINRNAIYTRWNIGEFGGNVIDIFNCDEEVLEKYFGIVNRFKYLLNANKVLLEKEEKIEEVEAGYANEIFEILKHYPKLQDAVMKQVKETLNEKKDSISVNKPNFAKTFNELLENVIQTNVDVLGEKEKIDFTSEKRNATVNLNIKRAEVLETETVDVDETKDADLQPKVIKLKTDNSYTSKTITELGEEFVSAHKNVMDKKKDQTQSKDDSREKDKLVATLVGAGLGAVIGGSAGAVVGAVAGNLVAEVAGKVNEVKSTKIDNNTNKKGGQQRQQSRQNQTRSQNRQSRSQKGQARSQNGRSPGEQERDQGGRSEPYRRLFIGVTERKEKEANKDVVAPKPSVEEMMKMEAEILKRRQNRTTALSTGVDQSAVVRNTKIKIKGVVAEANIEESSILTDL